MVRIELHSARRHVHNDKNNPHPTKPYPTTTIPIRNFVKRIVYNYFVRDFSVASLQLITGLVLLSFGIAYGFNNIHGDEAASAGTVMAAALPIMVGLQLLLAFLGFDIQATPTEAIHTKLKKHGLVCSSLAHENIEEK